MIPVIIDLTVLEKPFGIQILTPRAWLATLSREHRRQLKVHRESLFLGRHF